MGTRKEIAALRRSLPKTTLITLMVSLLALGACSNDDSSSTDSRGTSVTAEEYMGDVCAAMDKWIGDLQSGFDKTASLDPNVSVDQGKKALTDFLDLAVASTDELVESVRSAGSPEVDGGDEFSKDFLSGLSQGLAATKEARSQVDTLPSDPTKFGQASAQLGDTIRAQLSAAADAYGSRPETLDSAQKRTPECKDLRSTIGGP